MFLRGFFDWNGQVCITTNWDKTTIVRILLHRHLQSHCHSIKINLPHCCSVSARQHRATPVRCLGLPPLWRVRLGRYLQHTVPDFSGKKNSINKTQSMYYSFPLALGPHVQCMICTVRTVQFRLLGYYNCKQVMKNLCLTSISQLPAAELPRHRHCGRLLLALSNGGAAPLRAVCSLSCSSSGQSLHDLFTTVVMSLSPELHTSGCAIYTSHVWTKSQQKRKRSRTDFSLSRILFSLIIGMTRYRHLPSLSVRWLLWHYSSATLHW